MVRFPRLPAHALVASGMGQWISSQKKPRFTDRRFARPYWLNYVRKNQRMGAKLARGAKKYKQRQQALGSGPDHRTALRYHRMSQKQKNRLYGRITERNLVLSGHYERLADRRRSQSAKMPRRHGYRRKGKRRQAKPRYSRRPRARGRRPRRRAKTKLRLYPGGVPSTHIVKLRVMRQYVITTPSLEWGYVEFNPADMRIPFPGSKAAGTVNSHKNLKMATTAAGGATFSTNRQPYGYDHWLIDSGAEHSNYRHYKVLGSKITLRFVPSSRGADSGDNYYAGFSQLFTGAAGQLTSSHGPTLDSKYNRIAPNEIADWMNAGLVKRRKVVTTGGSGGRFQTFTFKYSAKKWERSLRRNGVLFGTSYTASDTQWMGTHGVSPVVNPVCYFMMADIGTSTAGQAINCMITIDYTVKLSSLDISQASLG